MADIHNRSGQLENLRENIEASEEITEENKDTLEDFYFWLKRQKPKNGTGDRPSNSTLLRYLQTGKKVAEHNDFDLQPMTREKADTIEQQIDASAYYSGEYSASTKVTHKKFIRTFAKFDDDRSLTDEVPDRVSFVGTTPDEKNYTSSTELLKPSHVRAMCRHMTNLRNQAFLLLQWDAGGRIGETADCRVGDFYQENGKYYIHIHGNKRSPDRDTRIHLAGPAIERWLKENHPSSDDDDAMLFCKLDPVETSEPPCYRQFRNILEDAKGEAEIEKEAQKSHLYRKSRVSYLAVYKDLPETAIDQRIGHVSMSNVTRRYARIGNKEANKAYDQSYGIEVNYEGEEDIEPIRCSECNDVNAGFRDRCFECDSILSTPEQEVSPAQVDRVKSLLIDVLKEEDKIDKLEEVMEA